MKQDCTFSERCIQQIKWAMFYHLNRVQTLLCMVMNGWPLDPQKRQKPHPWRGESEMLVYADLVTVVVVPPANTAESQARLNVETLFAKRHKLSFWIKNRIIPDNVFAVWNILSTNRYTILFGLRSLFKIGFNYVYSYIIYIIETTNDNQIQIWKFYFWC